MTNALTTTPSASIKMTSLELVDYLNHERSNGTDGYAEVSHSNFMARVPKVLGEGTAPKFLGTVNYSSGNGATSARDIYTFPKREACLMAMSCSYELQAKAFDKMLALQAEAAKLPTPKNFIEALRLALESAEKLEVARIQVESMKPAVEFVERSTGTVT